MLIDYQKEMFEVIRSETDAALVAVLLLLDLGHEQRDALARPGLGEEFRTYLKSLNL